MIACALSLPLYLFLAAPASQSGFLDLSRVVVRAADADRDGSVDADEWRAFRASLGAGEDGLLDRDALKARLLHFDWDADRDGIASASDLRLTFEELDVDGNGDLHVGDVSFGRSGRGGARGGYYRTMALAVLFYAADTNDDDLVSTEEWSALERAGGDGDGTIPMSAMLAWLADVESDPPPADQNAVTPSVYLLTITSSLDADFDGSVTLADIDAIFARYDGDGDGALAAEELAPRRRRATAQAPSVEEPPADQEGAAIPDPVMPWQRSLDDALALVERTGKPLLLCVNVDGETASEILARGRYRDPEFAELAAGFVPVLVAPFPHTAREYDDRGRRIPDPKYGRVVNSEHIDLDELVTERYFGGQRVAPRHLAVDAQGKTLFDIYLVNDLSVIDEALRRHGVFDADLPEPATQSEHELLDNPDAAARDRLEETFARGDERTRVRLASLCLSSARTTQHEDVLRMALLDPSRNVRRQAVWTIVQHPEKVSTELLLPAFRVANQDSAQLAALVSAVQRVADSSVDEDRRERAVRLERVYAGIQQRSHVLDVERWKLALSFAPRTEEVPPTVEQKSAVLDRIADLEERLRAAPEDRELNLLFADTMMRFARIQMLEGGNPTYLFEDVRTAAALATSEEEPDGRALGYLAWSSYMLGESQDATRYAAEALPHLRAVAGSPLAAQVLQVFSQGRIRSLYEAMKGTEWPTEWIADVRDAYEALLVHPSVSEKQVVDYLRFLDVVEAHALQDDVVRRGLVLFPDSTELHRSFRNQMLRDGGAGALVEAYETLPTPPEEAARFAWFAGLATLVAAERHVQNQKTEEAVGAYRLSVDRFRESMEVEPSFAGSASHYIALALAGTANLYLERERFEAALDAIREGIAESPQSATSQDGLGNTPAEIAGRIHRALIRTGHAVEASSLREELDSHGVRLGG